MTRTEYLRQGVRLVRDHARRFREDPRAYAGTAADFGREHQRRFRQDPEPYLGWTALLLTTAIACFWGFWSGLEGFHEGWWHPSLLVKILGIVAYASPMLILMVVAALSVWRPKVGAVLMFLFAIAFGIFIYVPGWSRMSILDALFWVPLTFTPFAIARLAWRGRPRPARLAYAVALGTPLLVWVGYAAEPAWRVSRRMPDDGVTSERRVQGNGVALTWAPEGPGWITEEARPLSWEQAMRIASRLSADGTRLEDRPVDLWRLPTVDEVVRSMTRRGVNAGGVWDAPRGTATYRNGPDKEPPLWRVQSPTIYWWTSTEAGPKRAYRVVYDGRVLATPKNAFMGSIGFRAVRSR
jgi:hypothetical protein